MTVLALVAINVATNRLVPSELYVPFALVAAAGLVAFAVRVDGRTWADLGLARSQVGRGLRWGAVLVGGVAGLYLVAWLLPPTRDLFLDERVQDVSLAGTVFKAFVRVPLGTVVLEEVAFRGVLPALVAARTRSLRWIVLLPAVLFGFWHVLPSIGFESVNPVAEDTVGALPGWVTVAGSVLFTGIAGVWFWWLRHRSDSLLAPMALHSATNGLGYLFSWLAWNV